MPFFFLKFSGAKRAEFLLKTDRFPGLKPYITTLQYKSTTTTAQRLHAGVQTLRATRPEYTEFVIIHKLTRNRLFT